MKDVRNSDMCRKISLINGVRLHTFEYRLSDHDVMLQYTNLRCIVMYFDPLNQKPVVDEKAREICKNIQLKTLYELFNVMWLILKDDPHKIKFMQLAYDDEVSELIYETEFMSKLLENLPKVHLHQIMISEAEINEIEGLPSELTDLTMVISVKVAEVVDDVVEVSDEVIEISDDSVIIVSDD